MNKQSWSHALYMRLSLLAPSAWALFGGMLAGLAINVLTAVRFDGQLSSSNKSFLLLSSASLLAAALAFGWLSVVLEEYRASQNLSELRMTIEVAAVRRRLTRIILDGLVSLVIGLVLLLKA